MTLVIPMVTWQDAREEWVVDIYSRLLQDRIIFLGTPIDEQIANLVVAELLHLESEQSDRDIAIYVNSPGGSVYAGLAIYDTMQFVRPDVQTMCVGIAMGMGALIVLGGTRGKRVALPHAKILLNQVSGGFEGEVSDIEIQAREVLALGRRLEEIIAEHTGQPLAKVASDLERDYLHELRGGLGLRRHRPSDLAPLKPTREARETSSSRRTEFVLRGQLFSLGWPRGLSARRGLHAPARGRAAPRTVTPGGGRSPANRSGGSRRRHARRGRVVPRDHLRPRRARR